MHRQQHDNARKHTTKHTQTVSNDLQLFNDVAGVKTSIKQSMMNAHPLKPRWSYTMSGDKRDNSM